MTPSPEALAERLEAALCSYELSISERKMVAAALRKLVRVERALRRLIAECPICDGDGIFQVQGDPDTSCPECGDVRAALTEE